MRHNRTKTIIKGEVEGWKESKVNNETGCLATSRCGQDVAGCAMRTCYGVEVPKLCLAAATLPSTPHPRCLQNSEVYFLNTKV